MQPPNIDKALKIAKAGKPAQMQVYFLHGIFGELPNCNAIAEEVIDNDEKLKKYGKDPAEGGIFVKVWGCSYLYRGNPAQANVFGLEQAKSMISRIPREILGKSTILQIAVATLFLFARRRLVNYIHRYFESIKSHSIRLYSPPYERLGAPVREIRRAMDVALKKELGIAQDVDLYNKVHPDYYTKYTTKQEAAVTAADRAKYDLAALVVKMTAMATLVMELDCAYRFPTQDILGEVDKENAARSGYKEAMRLFDLIIARQTNLTPIPGVSERTQGQPDKFIFLKKIFRAFLLLSPRGRRIAQRFFLELDTKRVGLDESDWYYCLRRNTHNYRGVPLPERLAELERIDKEKGHQYLKFQYQGFPGAPPIKA